MSERPEAAHLVPVEPEAQDLELRAWVERCLGQAADEFVRRPLAESTSFACEQLTVRAGGRTLELFFKDYGRCQLPRDGSEGARREIEVYRQLLDTERLGTARHVGSLLEPADGRTWLLLEHVRGSRLADRGFEHWLAAAAWLGRLQVDWVSRGPADRSPDWLAVHDIHQLRATAEEAIREVAAVDLQLERSLQEALEGYESLIEILNDQPRTLVHGSFRPENILVDPSAAPTRVAPVDWEHAALGSALHDVAILSAGLGRGKALQLVRALRDSAAEHGLRLPGDEEAWRLLSILRLHKLLRSLSRCRRWAYARETIEHLIELAGQLRSELPAGSAPGAAGPLIESHPASRAWRSLGRTEPVAGVELIVGRFFARKGRAVYRLAIEGASMPKVVVKRARCASLAVERHVHAELLPHMPVTTPGYLGSVGDGDSTWLFLEDVGSTRLALDDASQRASALRWLAGLHVAGGRLARVRLPDRGSAHFRELLLEARRAIVAALANPALKPAEREHLLEVVAASERAESRWGRLESLCARMRKTLVHGDYRPKNLLMRPGVDGLQVLPIDWEYAGWGVPALDLGSLLREGSTPGDLLAYRDALRNGSRRTSVDELGQWVAGGRILRAVSSMHWASLSLAWSSFEKPVGNLRTYAIALEQAFAELEAR